ncbi:MAG: fibronectin type III domain-containing protein, partial [Clostridia bacterium]|nr:fibronectin type III domain-containing protein [Clostridia bacterium]
VVNVDNVTDRLKVTSITLDKPEPDGKNDWYITPVKITIDKGENNPLAKETRYRLIKDGLATTQEEGGIYTEPITITEVGTYEIYAWVEDGEGWTSEETMPTDFQFDNVKPIIDTESTKLTKGRTYQNPNGTTWLVENGEITVVANDPKGILAGYTYEVYDLKDNLQEGKGSTKIQKLETKIPLTGEGEYKIRITAEDMAGNKSASFSIEIHKDSIMPRVDTPQISNITETGIKISVSAGDDTSKVAKYEYYLNGSNKGTSTNGQIDITGLTPNTSYSVTVKVYDNANNVNDKANAVPITTKGQLLPPRITPSTLNQYYTSDITISIADTAEASKTRASKIKYKRTSNAGEETINGTNGNFKITTDGTYQIYACTEDAQGNKSTWVNTNSFILDKINPSVTIQAGTGTTNSIPVTIKASDANGIKSYKYEYKLQSETTWKTATFSNNSYTGLSDGKTYDLKVTVTDGAGRTNSAQTTGTTKVANTPPYNLTASYSSKSYNYITVSARAYDTEDGRDRKRFNIYNTS